MSGENEEYVQRARVLTDADVKAIAEALRLQPHGCRFDNVTREDMDFVKDLLALYKETRSELLKWFIRGIVMFVLAFSTFVAYFKYKGT